jgi:hypothetical protein
MIHLEGGGAVERERPGPRFGLLVLGEGVVFVGRGTRWSNCSYIRSVSNRAQMQEKPLNVLSLKAPAVLLTPVHSRPAVLKSGPGQHAAAGPSGRRAGAANGGRRRARRRCSSSSGSPLTFCVLCVCTYQVGFAPRPPPPPLLSRFLSLQCTFLCYAYIYMSLFSCVMNDGGCCRMMMIHLDERGGGGGGKVVVWFCGLLVFAWGGLWGCWGEEVVGERRKKGPVKVRLPVCNRACKCKRNP